MFSSKEKIKTLFPKQTGGAGTSGGNRGDVILESIRFQPRTEGKTHRWRLSMIQTLTPGRRSTGRSNVWMSLNMVLYITNPDVVGCNTCSQTSSSLWPRFLFCGPELDNNKLFPEALVTLHTHRWHTLPLAITDVLCFVAWLKYLSQAVTLWILAPRLGHLLPFDTNHQSSKTHFQDLWLCCRLIVFVCGVLHCF